MASTKEQILGTPKENTQSTVPEVAAPPTKTPVPNGGTAPTGNDGNETQVNDGSAVVGAPATVPGGAVIPPSSPANANDGTAGSAVPTFDWNTGTMKGNEQQPITVPYEPGKEPKDAVPVTKKAPLPTAQPTPAGAQPPEAAQPAKAPERKMSYVEMFRQMSPYKPPTAEELENARKKEKRDKVFAAIGDGIAALSNLYFTTKGAPNAFDPRNSLSAKARERWDKLNKEREENARYYMQEAMKAQALDDDRDDKDRSYMSKLQNDYRNYLLKLSADNRAAELHDLDKQLRQGKINEQTYKAKKAEVEAKYAEDNQKSVIAKNKAAAKASNASAANSYASAEEHRTNARGRFQWWDENGNVHYAKTQEEAITKARQHGTLDSVKVDTTTSTESDATNRGKPVYVKDKDGNPVVQKDEKGKPVVDKEGKPVYVKVKKSSSTTTSKPVYYPGIRQKQKPNPMHDGGRGGGKKKNPMS
jgi:hypothetical protein